MRKAETLDEMSYPRKYRPKSFDELKGNRTVVLGILNALKGNHRVFLITGPTGCGKTTIARLIAAAVECHPAMFIEMNAANTRGIDSIRGLISDSEYEPALGVNRVILLDECHQITGTAAEALLKFLEDTPKNTYIILCTTEPDKLLETIKNRCSKWVVSPLDSALMANLMDEVLAKEGKTVPKAIKSKIVSIAEGCPRQALKLLEQVVDVEGEANQLQILQDQTVDEALVKDICSRIRNKGSWSDREVAGAKEQGLCRLLGATILDKEGKKESEPESIRRGVLGWFATVLISTRDQKDAARIVAIMDIFSEPIFYTGKAGLIKACWKALQV